VKERKNLEKSAGSNRAGEAVDLEHQSRTGCINGNNLLIASQNAVFIVAAPHCGRYAFSFQCFMCLSCMTDL
jgi:hypothetical protein